MEKLNEVIQLREKLIIDLEKSNRQMKYEYIDLRLKATKKIANMER
jgi:hypothetical protein